MKSFQFDKTCWEIYERTFTPFGFAEKETKYQLLHPAGDIQN